MSSARSVEEMRARAREATVMGARAVLATLDGERFEGENGAEMSTTFNECCARRPMG